MSSPQNQPKQFPNTNSASPSKPPQWLIVAGAVFGGLFILCCGCPVALSFVVPRPGLEADRAWAKGNKAKAVEHYRKVIDGDPESANADAYSRAIEFYAEQNNAAEADRIADLAVSRRIPIGGSAAAVSKYESALARKRAGEEQKRQKELADKAKTEADAAKAAEDRQARLRKHLDNFKFLLAAHAPGSEKIIRNFKVETMGIEIESMEITVANDWHVQPYQIRLQMAQNLWNTWVKASDKKEKPDTARIKIVDLNGNEVGGSRVIAGSSIWVQEK